MGEERTSEGITLLGCARADEGGQSLPGGVPVDHSYMLQVMFKNRLIANINQNRM